MVTSCQKDPQKSAEHEAEKEQRMADQDAEKAAEKMATGMEHANSSMEHQEMADLNAALASVSVPTFENGAASELAKKIGNHAKEYVNANNFEESGKYADKINADLTELASKVAKGNISSDEATQITDYAKNLATAVRLEL